MKKNRINAFTLVEMLIVIVIIGILIAALMPRMQAAQGRARDVSRKTALSQIQSAIVVSQWDKWQWPGVCDEGECADDCGSATEWVDVECIRKELTSAWMNGVPIDPLAATVVSWLWDDWNRWQYRYMVTKRNWASEWWFILMAKTEVEWWSNFVICDDSDALDTDTDIADPVQFALCTSVSKVEEGDSCVDSLSADNWQCYYETDDQLRYVVVY